MVAAILELILFSTNKCVLVCSQSNSACDDIAKKLMVHLDQKQILRMYAKSCKTVDPTLAPISNFKNGKLELPCLKQLYSYRVIVCTISTAGSITRSRRLDKNFNSKFFSHVFIDEAAFITEILTIVAIAGLYNLNFSSESFLAYV